MVFSSSEYNLDHSDQNSKKNLTIDSINNDAKSILQIWKSYPKCIFCIIGNEFCERFSFYGMTTVLIFYLVNVLDFQQNTASSIFHGFSFFASFTPIFGSILSDGFIGKYHTIMWVSLFYACGSVTLAVAASFKKGSSVHPWLDFVGLFIISLGTGGIKPSVSPFGGDQFKKGQERALGAFFSIFYFTINVGAFISGIVSPLFRVKPCLGEDTCYPLTFGFPAVLMVLSCIIFAAGTPFYKRYPPKGNLLIQVLKIIWKALGNKIISKEKHSHWLEYYLDTHTCQDDPLCRENEHCQKTLLIKDIQAIVRVLVIFIPIPFFWALYSLGDRWSLQAANMNGKYGDFIILPDQMGVVNTVLVLAFIPLFESVLYPLLSKICKLTQLRKMSAGGFLAVIAGVLCGFLQLKVNTTLPTLPAKNTAFFTVLNYATCPITVTSANDNSSIVNLNSTQSFKQTLHNVVGTNQFRWAVQGQCLTTNTLIANLTNVQSTYAIITNNHFGWNYANLQKSSQGKGQFKISVNYFAENNNVIIENNTVQLAWCTSDVYDTKICTDKNADHYSEFSGTVYGGSEFVELLPVTHHHIWYLYVKYNDGSYYNTNISYDQEHQGGIYTLTVLSGKSDSFTGEMYQIAPDNTVSVFWQLPQYILLSAAEILFSVTGLEFTFTQAPASMKSIMMAIWLLTSAIGQLLVILVNLINFSNIANLFFLFSLLMFIVMFIFVLLAVFYYKYVEESKVN